MAKKEQMIVEFGVAFTFTNQRAAKELGLLADTLAALDEEGRDVKRALRAVRYLVRNISVHLGCGDCTPV